MNIIKKHIPTILFCAILLIVVLLDSIKWWFTGGIFLLDFVPMPIYEYNFKLLETSLFWNIYNRFGYIIWYILWSKIYIYWLILATMMLWYKLSKYICNRLYIEDILHQNAIYIAWIAIMTINPFFVERMATQPTVRNGILLLAIWIYILVADQADNKISYESRSENIYNINNRKNIIYVWILWWFARWVMNHSIFMIALLSLAYIYISRFKKNNILKIIYINIIVWLINIGRIIWSFYGANDVVRSATSFSQENISAFATQSLWWLPVEVSTALWYGFWAEQWERLVTADNGNKLWRIFWIIILSIWIYGICSSLKIESWKLKVNNIEDIEKNHKNVKSDNKIIYISIFLMITTLWLWIGVSNNFGGEFANRMYENIPWYRWFREPHKRIGIYMIILIPYIIIWFAKLSKKIDYTILLPVFIFLLYGRAPWIINMWWLYKPTDYPAEYQDSRSYILSKYPDSKWILVPRHSYMWCDRNSNVMYATAGEIYKPSIVKVADNIEIWSLYTNNSNNISNQIDAYIYSWQDNHIIKNLGYSWFIFWKWCADTWNYQWIDNKNKFDNIYSGKDVWVYIVK